MNPSNDSQNGKMWAGFEKYTFLIPRQFMCVCVCLSIQLAGTDATLY